MFKIRAKIFKIIFPIATIIWSILIILMSVLPFRVQQYLASFWGDTVIFLFRTICGVKVNIQGKENIPKETIIVMANHQSTWETAFLPTLKRQQVWILKKELLSIPIFGWALKALKSIAIDRSKGKSALKQVNEDGIKALQAGRSVLVFPEGTRSDVDNPQKFRMGGALLAEASAFDVLLIAHNAGQFWSNKGEIHSGTIEVVIGPVIKSVGKSAQEINKIAEDWISETREKLVLQEKQRRGMQA